MPTIWYMTDVDVSNSLLVTNFNKWLDTTAPASTTLSVTIANLAIELSAMSTFSDAASNADGALGKTGPSTGTWSLIIEITSGNPDLEIQAQISRRAWNGSSWVFAANSGYTAEQNAASGPLTFDFVDPGLGTWDPSDALLIFLQTRDTSAHQNENITFTLGASGIRISVPDDVAATDYMPFVGGGYFPTG